MSLFGVSIVASELAREVRDEFRVERIPRKRRKAYRVVKHRIDRPGAFQCGDTIIMHPDLIAQLRKTVADA